MDNWVKSIAVAPDGPLWFGTWDHRVARFDPAAPSAKAWTTYTEEDGLADDCVTAIFVAPDGALWFGTVEGMSRYLPPE